MKSRRTLAYENLVCTIYSGFTVSRKDVDEQNCLSIDQSLHAKKHKHIGERQLFTQKVFDGKSGAMIKVSSDAIFGEGATLIYKLLKMKLFRAPQSSVVHVKAVLRSNQPLV